MIAWRGVVVDGEVYAWPTAMMTHVSAFQQFPPLRNHDCRWRQWSPGTNVDFDPDASPESRELVRNWITRVNG